MCLSNIPVKQLVLPFDWLQTDALTMCLSQESSVICTENVMSDSCIFKEALCCFGDQTENLSIYNNK